MKIHGKELVPPPKEQTLVIPRGDERIVFKAKMVEDYSAFHAICPKPEPRKKMVPGGSTITDLKDPGYQKKLNDWKLQQINWMFIESLSATEGLEYSLVDPSKPETYDQFDEEFVKAGFSSYEIVRIVNMIQEVNGLNQSRIDEATEHFLEEEQAQLENASSQKEEANSTPSGELAKDSA